MKLEKMQRHDMLTDHNSEQQNKIYWMQRIMEALVSVCTTDESSGEPEGADVQQRRGHGRPGGHHGRPGGHHGGSHGGRIKIEMVMMVNFVITMYTWYKKTMFHSNDNSFTLYFNGNWTRPLPEYNYPIFCPWHCGSNFMLQNHLDPYL